jgi:hypothetical protein
MTVGFCCPRYIQHSALSVDDALQQLQQYLQQHSYDALEWMFPPQSYSYTSVPTSKIHPGVILFAKDIKECRPTHEVLLGVPRADLHPCYAGRNDKPITDPSH